MIHFLKIFSPLQIQGEASIRFSIYVKSAMVLGIRFSIYVKLALIRF
jgi:hypothetical protein